MKKLFLSVAMIAVLASCSKNNVGGDTTPKQNQIGFSTLNDKVTRAPSDTKGLGYVVYAQYTTAVDATDWYVKAVAVSSDDIATDAPYWPELSLDFYAYAATPANIAVTATTVPTATAKGAISAVYTVNATASEDFTVATPVTQQYTGAGDFTVSKVPLVFKHMLSRVMVSANLASAMVEDGYKLNLTGVKTTLTVVNNKGTVDVIAVNPAITAEAGAATYTKNNVDAEIATNAKSTAIEFLIMPQAAANYCTVTITGVKLTHATNQPIAVTLSKTFKEGDVQAFVQGTQYNLNFEVSLTKITFSSTVTGWTAGGDITLNPVTQAVK